MLIVKKKSLEFRMEANQSTIFIFYLYEFDKRFFNFSFFILYLYLGGRKENMPLSETIYLSTGTNCGGEEYDIHHRHLYTCTRIDEISY